MRRNRWLQILRRKPGLRIDARGIAMNRCALQRYGTLTAPAASRPGQMTAQQYCQPVGRLTER